jgi:membrane-associated protease RseP (regulator of RpoE activity)
MLTKHWKTRLACGVMVAVPWLAASAAAQEAAREPRPAWTRVAQPEGGLLTFVAEAEPLRGEYWLGISLGTLPDVAKDQLGIGHGLVVSDVRPDDPAAKAGIQKHDILIKAGDAALKTPADLIKAVDAAKETELTLTVVRGGKELAIKVTPIKRSEAQDAVTLRPRGEFREEIKRLEEALENLKGKVGEQPLSLFLARPGVVAPGITLTKPAELPQGMVISVSKEGDKPATIHVKRGDQEWEVTEDKLGDLPEDVRKHVEKFLQRMAAPGIAASAVTGFLGGLKVAPTMPVPPVPPAAVLPPAPPKAPARTYSYRLESSDRREGKLDMGALEDKLTSIMKKLDELRKDVDELRTKSPGDGGKK